MSEPRVMGLDDSLEYITDDEQVGRLILAELTDMLCRQGFVQSQFLNRVCQRSSKRPMKMCELTRQRAD